MPADPEMPITIKDMLLGLFGLGGGEVALRTIGRYEQRIDTAEKTIDGLKAKDAEHDKRVGAIEVTLGVLNERSEQAALDREELKKGQGEIIRILTER